MDRIHTHIFQSTNPDAEIAVHLGPEHIGIYRQQQDTEPEPLLYYVFDRTGDLRGDAERLGAKTLGKTIVGRVVRRGQILAAQAVIDQHQPTLEKRS